jgi:uncharacterized OsmC-like protein
MIVIRGKWTSETLKEAMDVVEKKTCSLQRPTSHGTCLLAPLWPFEWD